MRVVIIATACGAAVGLSGCMSMPKMAPNSFTSRSASAAGSAASDTYDGLGGAMQAPMRDLNLVHDDVPPILVRAYARPYDMTGLDACEGISEQVRLLDLALGPDVDIPRGATPEKDMFAKGASLAADAALDTVRSATTGVIPVRSWVRRFSGANRAEQEAKAVALSGAVRRGYLKALGQTRGCEWPASPLRPHSLTAAMEAQSGGPMSASVQRASRVATQLPPPEAAGRSSASTPPNLEPQR